MCFSDGTVLLADVHQVDSVVVRNPGIQLHGRVQRGEWSLIVKEALGFLLYKRQDRRHSAIRTIPMVIHIVMWKSRGRTGAVCGVLHGVDSI